MTLYTTPALPRHWVIEDNDGTKWLVPAYANGWRDRKPYHGNYELDQAHRYFGLGLGIPNG